MYVVPTDILRRDVHTHINTDFLCNSSNTFESVRLLESIYISTWYMNRNQSFGALHLLVNAVWYP